MYKRILTYLLLFAFVVIFSPKSLWHSHVEIETKSKKGIDKNHSHVEEDCYVCDFTLQPALTPVNFPFNFPYLKPFISSDIAISLCEARELSVLSLRG